MDAEVDVSLEERWLDYKTELERTVEELKADPANRFSRLKAWLNYIAKSVVYSLSGAAVLLLAISLGMPQLWGAILVVGVLTIWWWMALIIGSILMPIIFPPPVRYWERRASKILEYTDIPPRHRAL